MANHLTVPDKLNDSHIEDVIERIIKGEHYRDIAGDYDISLYSLFKFLTQEKHSERVKEARQYAAHVLVDEAERVLAQAKTNPALFYVAKELAHHYRWKAAMIYGRQYAPKTIKEEEPETEKKITIKVIRGNGNNA